MQTVCMGWLRYISVNNLGRLNKVLCRAKRYGFINSVLTLSEILEQSGVEFHVFIVCTNRCLFHLLEKDNSQLQVSLRPRVDFFQFA